MPCIARFDANPNGRDFVVGDIHGWFEPLELALEQVGFDCTRDRLFSVGDLIDRGPESERCLFLQQEPWFAAVRGNHEQILFDWLRDPDSTNVADWLRYGGAAWLGEGPEQYFQCNPQIRAYAEQLAVEMPWVIELSCPDGRRVAISHSTLPVTDWELLHGQLESDPRLQQAILWERPVKQPGFAHRVEGIDLCIHGHVIVPDPMRRGNGVYIDTGAALFGMGVSADGSFERPRLTLVEVSSLFSLP